MTIGGVPPYKPWFINPGLTLFPIKNVHHHPLEIDFVYRIGNLAH
jgi:hypothetical protein